MTITQNISLTRLVQSRANVRRTGQTGGIEALMASIAAHGLRQNLNVLPTTGGRFEVVAGGRRLIALKKLARAGTIASDMPVPCLVLTEADNATEISLAENQMRVEMHPDDQCEAFRSLTDGGMPVEDVAARFGVTPAVVRQRLRLAAVSPKLRALYRAGNTTLAHLMALTLTDDHAAQEAAYAEGRFPDSIRRLLTQASVRADARLATFVGLDAYRAAGGGVLDDLFNPADSYLTDPALLHGLATAKLEAAAAEVQAEGWSWVLPQLERDYATPYRRLHGERDHDGTIVFSPDQLASAGARVTLGYDGGVEVDRGLVRPADSRRIERAESEPSPERADYPAAVLLDLTGHRTVALRLALARNPRVALVATVHALATSGTRSALQVMMRTRDLGGVVADTAECTAHAAMAAEVDRWHDRTPADKAALWEWLLAQDTETLLDMLATFAALTLDAVAGTAHGGSLRHADQLAAALDLDMAEHWQPTAAFMARLRKSVMAAALTEAGQKTAAADIAIMKKPAAAARAAQALAGIRWLPLVLRRQDAVAVNDNVSVVPWEGDDAERDEEAA